MKTKKKIAISAIAGYGLLVGALWAIQDQLVFPGTKRTKYLKELKKTVSRTYPFVCEDGTVLSCFEEGPEDAPAILVLPGNGGNAIKYIHWLRLQLKQYELDSKVRIVSLHYRGYGYSSGKVKGHKILNDLIQFTEHLKPISVFGRSLGAGLGASIAAKFDLPAVLISPWDSLLTVASAKVKWVIPKLLMSKIFRHDIKTLKHADKTLAPLAIISFEQDETVHPDRSKSLYSSWNGPKELRMLPGKHTTDVDLTYEEVSLLLKNLE